MAVAGERSAKAVERPNTDIEVERNGSKTRIKLDYFHSSFHVWDGASLRAAAGAELSEEVIARSTIG